MINALETSLTFLRNVREIFAKADGRTSNCPRCQGSGLLTNRSGWGCGQVLPIGNDFCWFCEGIGVIQIIGLSGFMLG
ncbi:unnamed protein product [Sphagnum jensenii]|uniref:Uncharacterized protein n=1 Tax=Sphagnum jensenii TaxID=128206 RepID=A0ABP1BZH2_9BRYO